MSHRRELWMRVLSVLGVGHRDEVLSEELDHHLELLRQEFIDRGLSKHDLAR